MIDFALDRLYLLLRASELSRRIVLCRHADPNRPRISDGMANVALAEGIERITVRWQAKKFLRPLGTTDQDIPATVANDHQMFLRIEISGFRSCRHVIVSDIGPIIALVGRNGAGKTNILRAIHWAASAATNPVAISPPTWAEGPTGAPASPSAILNFVLEEKQYRHEIALRAAIDPISKAASKWFLVESLFILSDDGAATALVTRNDEEVRLQGRDEIIRISSTISVLIAIKSVLPSDDQLLDHVNRVFRFLSGVRYYGTDASDETDSAFFIQGAAYNQWLSTFREKGVPGNSVNMRIIHMWLEQTKKFEELKSLMGVNGLGIIPDIHVQALGAQGSRSTGSTDQTDTTPSFYLIYFLTEVGRQYLGIHDLSFGTHRILRILISMIFDESSVMLIEQPEDGIHAGLTKKVFNILRSYTDPSQILLATHSTVLLNELKADEIRIVAVANGQTIASPLTPSQRESASKYLIEDGTFAEYISLLEAG
jgi:ABC-type branched-subunit amino acid transport system ATPase component